MMLHGSRLALALIAALGTGCLVGVGDAPSAGDDNGSPTGPGPGPGSNPGGPPGTGTPGARRTVGYFAAWDVYGRAYHVSDLPVDQLTAINYAFLNISSTGECVLGDAYADTGMIYPGDSQDPAQVHGSFHQLQLLKQAHPQLKVLLSVGGWTWSTYFSDLALTAASRTHFAQSCVALLDRYGFDGLDIDWEYPGGGGLAPGRPEDTQNYTALLAAFRAQLGSRLLTIAAPAGASQIAKLDLAGIAPLVDWVNLMAYDFHGSFEMATNFGAPLRRVAMDHAPGADRSNVTAAVDAWLAALPAAKLVLGMPLYGYGWAGVAATNDGLFQPAASIPMGTWAAGNFDYHDIVARYLPTMTLHWSDEAQAPWLYDPARGLAITYDDARSLTAKTDLVRDRGLGGAMFWELSSDDAAHTLVRAVHAELAR